MKKLLYFSRCRRTERRERIERTERSWRTGPRSGFPGLWLQLGRYLVPSPRQDSFTLQEWVSYIQEGFVYCSGLITYFTRRIHFIEQKGFSLWTRKVHLLGSSTISFFYEKDLFTIQQGSSLWTRRIQSLYTKDSLTSYEGFSYGTRRISDTVQNRFSYSARYIWLR